MELKPGMRVRVVAPGYEMEGAVERVDVVKVRTDCNIIFHFVPEELEVISSEDKDN